MENRRERGTKRGASAVALAEPASAADDTAAFRAALKDVRPLANDTVPLRKQAPPPIPQQTQRDEQAVLAEMALMDPSEAELECGEELLFRRDGVQQTVLRKLRRGQFAIQGQLDLHGMTAAEAKTHLVKFLQYCIARELVCVHIIHGKGRRSPGKLPVLKPKVAHWLAQRNEVIAYVSARREDGGTGAIYVLLRRRR